MRVVSFATTSLSSNCCTSEIGNWTHGQDRILLVNADAGCNRCSELARGNYGGYSPELISLEWFQSIVGSDAGS